MSSSKTNMSSFVTRTTIACSLGILVACRGEQAKETIDTVTATASALPTPTEGFKTPESVRYDPSLDAYFVSNIDGNPNAKDNNGFISRLDAANPATATVVVQGGQGGVELNAPKGLALSGDTLWVSDIDVLRAFDKNTGAALATIAVKGATFLNDVVVGPDGTVYVTDSGIHFDEKGEMTHPGKDRIYAIKGGTATVAIESDSLLAGPNGIAWDGPNARFVIASFGGPLITGWKPGESTVTTIATGPGGHDGIEVLADGRVVVSSWADSSLNIVDAGQVTRLAGGLDGPADIGIDTKRDRVAVPRFSAGRVDYVALPPR
jgi:sugar lactone lactonase YvrE